MARDGVFRNCKCFLCIEANGAEGCQIPDHQWKSHLRLIKKTRAEEDQEIKSQSSTAELARLVFGLTLNDEVSGENDPLWNSKMYDIEPDILCVETQIEPLCPEEIASALSKIVNASGERPYSKNRNSSSKFDSARVIFRDKTTSIQRKFARAFSHISTQRHFKRLEQIQVMLDGLTMGFDDKLDLKSMEESLSIARKELLSIPVCNVVVKERRLEKLKVLEALESRFNDERSKQADILQSKEPEVFNTGSSHESSLNFIKN